MERLNLLNTGKPYVPDRLVALKSERNQGEDYETCSGFKKGCVTAGKAFAGGIFGAVMDTFIMPAAMFYYNAKSACHEFKNPKCDHDWREHIAMLVLSPSIIPLGFIYGAITGAKKAIEEKDGVFSYIKNVCNDGVAVERDDAKC